MKNFKRTMAAVMTSALLLTPCVAATTMTASVSAAQITVNNAVENHTYTAYPIFTGSISDKSIGNPVWGTGVDSTNLVNDLKKSNAFGAINPFNVDTVTASDPKSVIDVLATLSTDQKALDAFAEIANRYKSTTSKTGTYATRKYTISDLADGYYLILDSAGESATDKVIARYILEVTGGTAEINNKVARPTLDKYIVEGNSLVKGNTAAIDDEIHYKLTSTVPDMTGYEKYFFVVTDTMSKGIAYDSSNDDFKIIIGDTNGDGEIGTGETGKVLEKDTDYTVSSTLKDDETTTLKVVFKSFIDNQSYAGKHIDITYKAKLDTEADTTYAGNPNTAKLTYSNNPNYDQWGKLNDNGTPDDPTDDKPQNEDDKPDSPTDDTPEKTVKTYTTKLIVNKVDGNENALEGAGFTLYLYSGNETTLSGVKNDNTANIWTAVGNEVGGASNGISVFDWNGIDEGWYKIVETTTPGGYNTAEDVIFYIDGTVTTEGDTTSISWKEENNENVDYVVMENGTKVYAFKTTIQNNKGSQLPSTGGIGTTLFYIIGGMLVVGSTVVLVTKKRMSAEKK